MLTNISENEWINYFKELYETAMNTPDNNIVTIDIKGQHQNQEFNITQDEVDEAIAKLKNRKSLGVDLITNEMIRYGGIELARKITKLLQKIISSGNIPEEWRISIAHI